MLQNEGKLILLLIHDKLHATCLNVLGCIKIISLAFAVYSVLPYLNFKYSCWRLKLCIKGRATNKNAEEFSLKY